VSRAVQTKAYPIAMRNIGLEANGYDHLQRHVAAPLYICSRRGTPPEDRLLTSLPRQHDFGLGEQHSELSLSKSDHPSVSLGKRASDICLPDQ